MNRHISILFISILFFSGVSFSQSKNEAEIRKVLAWQQNSWNAGDIDKFMQTYWNNDSLMFIGKSGITYGWEKTLKNYKKSYPDTTAMGQLTFTILSLKPLSPEYYFLTGKFHLDRTIGNLEGFFTLLFQKINGKWLIIVDHTS